MGSIVGCKHVGLPVVLKFFDVKDFVFLNTAHTESKYFEALGNFFLSPYRYLFGGKDYIYMDSKLVAQSSFPNRDNVITELWKTAAAIALLPVVVLLGSICKGISFLIGEGKAHHDEITAINCDRFVQPRAELQPAQPWVRNEPRVPRPSQELTEEIQERIQPLLSDKLSETHQKEIAALPEIMQKDLIALQDIQNLLKQHQIPHWIEAGTCLGLFRHDGVIPWDYDIDLAICEEDHDDVLKASRDPEFSRKYRMMDWSPADQPKTLLKCYIKETGSMIDVYHYRTAEANGQKTIVYISPYYDKWYLPQELRVREEVCLRPEPYENIFPLQSALLDGIEVFVPANMEPHLQGIYGERLDPAKVWDESKKAYVNVEGHPYWEVLKT